MSTPRPPIAAGKALPQAAWYASLGGTEQQAALRGDLERFFIETNQGGPGAWQVEGQYLGIEARKR